jgi:hypothetical protein
VVRGSTRGPVVRFSWSQSIPIEHESICMTDASSSLGHWTSGEARDRPVDSGRASDLLGRSDAWLDTPLTCARPQSTAQMPAPGPIFGFLGLSREETSHGHLGRSRGVRAPVLHNLDRSRFPISIQSKSEKGTRAGVSAVQSCELARSDLLGETGVAGHHDAQRGVRLNLDRLPFRISVPIKPKKGSPRGR